MSGAAGQGDGREPISTGITAMLTGYDFELPLTDALNDPSLTPGKRALAALAMGTSLDDGHLAAVELAEAAGRLAADREAGVPDAAGEGAFRLREILTAPCDDDQRALWFAVSRLVPAEAAGHLCWLAGLMRDRAGMFRTLRDARAPMSLLPGVGTDDTGSAQLGIG